MNASVLSSSGKEHSVPTTASCTALNEATGIQASPLNFPVIFFQYLSSRKIFLLTSTTQSFSMGLFSSKKKSTPLSATPKGPYKEESTNLIYHLLFCDSLDLYKINTKPPYSYPFDVLFSPASTIDQLQSIVDDNGADPRVRTLAYNKMLAAGHHPAQKELLGVIVEVGLDNGLDVLASFSNGTARYINQTGKLLIWETTDKTSAQLTDDLFEKSRRVVEQIGPWDQPRRPWPAKGMMRITFLVSDGFYFGEGAVNSFFEDPLAKPALSAATQLMLYLTQR
jgi:hypothetical protein